MNTTIQYHRTQINKLEKEIREISSEQIKKIQEMSKELKISNERKPLFKWYRTTEGCKEV